MNKKKLLILGGILVVVLVVCFVIFAFLKSKNNETPKVLEEIIFDTTVVSTVTMDINPSIKVNINKDNKVIEVIALNEDAKSIISDELKEKNISDVIEKLTSNLLSNDYFKDDATIILSVEGEVSSEDIKNVISDTLKKENVLVTIIEPVITKSGKKIAEDLGITEAKASYLEEVISKNPSLKIEDIKDKSVKEIDEAIKEIINKNENQSSNTTTPNTNTNTNTNTSKPSGGNSLQKCENVNKALNNEEAGKKAAGLQGATVGTGSYCDILPPESVWALTSNGTCAYKVSFAYMTNKCVYYISMETGEVLSSNCEHKNITEGEHQCIIMKDLGVTKREMAYIYDTVDAGSEYTSRVEDVYGTPDAEGKRYVYRYHVSKSTGSLTKEKLYELK